MIQNKLELEVRHKIQGQLHSFYLPSLKQLDNGAEFWFHHFIDNSTESVLTPEATIKLWNSLYILLETSSCPFNLRQIALIKDFAGSRGEIKTG